MSKKSINSIKFSNRQLNIAVKLLLFFNLMAITSRKSTQLYIAAYQKLFKISNWQWCDWNANRIAIEDATNEIKVAKNAYIWLELLLFPTLLCEVVCWVGSSSNSACFCYLECVLPLSVNSIAGYVVTLSTLNWFFEI